MHGSILSAFTFLPTCFLSQSSGPSREIDRFFEKAPTVEEKARDLLSKVEAGKQPELRFAAVRELAELGEPAIPLLEKTAEGGNREKARAALFALARMRTESAKGALLRAMSARDLELQVVGTFAAAEHRGSALAEKVVSLLQLRSADPYLRLAAATAASVFDGIPPETFASLLRSEANPEIAGAAAVALGRRGGEAAIPALVQALAEAKDPAQRAGIWIGLAFAGGTAPEELALADLQSRDPVLAASAALAIAEIPSEPGLAVWEKAFRNGDARLKAAMLEGISRGSGFRARTFLFEASQTERDLEVRRAVLRSALQRQDYGLAFSVRRNRAGESLGGYWALTMALLTLDGVRGDRPNEGTLRALRELAGSWDDSREPFPAGSVLWLAAAGGREEEGFLLAAERRGGPLVDAARTARKVLRGEMDHRSFREEARRLAESERLLPGQGLLRLHSLYAAALLGGGSQFFESRSGFPKQALLAPGEKRRARPIPFDSTFYEDLWYWLESDALERR